MSRTPSLFVFDWDGTLADSTSRIVEACGAVFREQGWPAPEPARVRSLIGLSLERTFDELMPEASTRDLNRAARRYRELWVLGSSQPSALFEGVMQCLTCLGNRGAMLAVATGKGRAGLDCDLREHGIDRLIAASRCAGEAASKPAPDMLLEIMDELGVPAADVLMVGDTTYDMEMAMAAGVARLGVRSGVHGEASLRKYTPLDVIGSVSELPTWLQNRPIDDGHA